MLKALRHVGIILAQLLIILTHNLVHVILRYKEIYFIHYHENNFCVYTRRVVPKNGPIKFFLVPLPLEFAINVTERVICLNKNRSEIIFV